MSSSGHRLSDHQEFLQTAAEKFASGLSASLQDLLRQAVLLKPSSACLLLPGQYLLPSGDPSCCFSLGVGPVSAKKGGGCAAEGGRLELSPTMANCLVEVLLGGTPETVRVRPLLTAVDRRILRGVIEHACRELSFVFAGENVWMPELDASAGSAEPTAAVRFTFDARIGSMKTAFHLSLREDALQSSLSQGRYVGDANSAHLCACVEETVEGPLQLEAGDLLATNTPPEGEVLVRVDGEPKFFGKLARINGHRAITITRKIDPK